MDQICYSYDYYGGCWTGFIGLDSRCFDYKDDINGFRYFLWPYYPLFYSDFDYYSRFNDLNSSYCSSGSVSCS